MPGNDDVKTRLVGSIGRITLARPQSLNALSHGMTTSIHDALTSWKREAAVQLVVIDAEGERAFCAGGDLTEIYAAAQAGSIDRSRAFWVDEYRLNAEIDRYPVPFVAFMDGIVMGGGVGLSGHGSHRIVTERSMVAMPECSIGMVPDVGGTYLLSRSPGRLGEFLALTGWRMTGADAIFAGFADVQMRSGDLGTLKERLEAKGDVAAIDTFAHKPATAPLAEHMHTIDRHFALDSALECLRSLETDSSDFAQTAAAMIRRGCPLSLACAFELVRGARGLGAIEQALTAEYRFTYRSVTDGQFIEGIRAQIIDKDRNPKWWPDRLEDVADEAVARMLAPLSGAELTFPGGTTQ